MNNEMPSTPGSRRKKMPKGQVIKAQSETAETSRDETPYPLELVANIAMQMILGGRVLNRPGENGVVTGFYLYPDAAEMAMQFLDDCHYALTTRQARRDQRAKDSLEQAILQKKHPTGMPFLKGLFYITGNRKESDALPVFKAWLRQEKLATWEAEAVKSADEEVVTHHLRELRTNNFPLSSLDPTRREFQRWKEVVYLPNIKKSSGESGGKANKAK